MTINHTIDTAADRTVASRTPTTLVGRRWRRRQRTQGPPRTPRQLSRALQYEQQSFLAHYQR